MKKNFFGLLLFIISIVYIYCQEINDFEYIIINDGIMITDYSYKGVKNVDIPEIINGLKVVSIGKLAFNACNLTSVVIPNTVISIGEYAFINNQLTSVTIPGSVTFIGDYAFAQNKLSEINISNNINSIGEKVFSFNQLTNINIPDGVTNIGNYAFYSNHLNCVNIPDSVISIGDSTFSNNQIVDITIGNGVISIGKSAFMYNKITNINIPDNVKSIGEFAFAENPLIEISITNQILIPRSATYSRAINVSHLLNKYNVEEIMKFISDKGTWIDNWDNNYNGTIGNMYKELELYLQPLYPIIENSFNDMDHYNQFLLIYYGSIIVFVRNENIKNDFLRFYIAIVGEKIYINRSFEHSIYDEKILNIYIPMLLEIVKNN